MTETAALLRVTDLRAEYPMRRSAAEVLRRRPRRSVRAVDGVSLSVAPGELLAIVGESGSGKTSTLDAVLGMVTAASGTIEVDGTDITGLSRRRLRPYRRHMQVVYQDPYDSLELRFRVRQLVEEPLLVHKVGRTRADRARLVEQALVRAGLTPPDDFVDRYPHELSGGQRQRVAIAISLVLEPRLLLADEPVSMLDVSVRAGVLALLDELRRDGSMGVMMITHDLSTAARYADRIAVMYLGRIVEQGTATEVIRTPLHPYTRALLAAVPRSDPRDRGDRTLLMGDIPDPTALPTGCRFHPRCPLAEERCADHDPALAPAVGHQAACLVTSPEPG